MSTDPASSSLSVEVRLARHAARRHEGLPAVSTLVGPAGPAALAWRRWTAAAGLAPVTHACAEPDTLVPGLLADLTIAYDLRALGFRHLHAAAGLPPPSPAARSPGTGRDIDQLAAAAAGSPDPAGTTRVAHALLEAEGNTAQFVARLDAALARGAGRPLWRVLRAVDGLLPADGRPAVLFIPPTDDSAAADWLSDLARPLEHFVEAVPRWCVGVCCPTAALAQFRREARPSRAKSLVLAGEAPLPVLTPADLADRLRAVAADTKELDRAVRGLTAVGITEALVDAYATAVRLRPRGDDEARSAAERFLFELLELHPRTAGRFALNGNPGFHFGPRPAEVDLLAAGLRLAVEIDGYHHFTEADAYRRDRRKDWELQRHGYAVVRVLADDVVSRMENVLDTIVAAVDHCARQPDREGIDRGRYRSGNRSGD